MSQTEFDIGPLTWVKAEIDAAILRAKEQIAHFAGNLSDTTPLRFAQPHLHQVKGAIQMVGLDGLARFVEEVERFMTALESREVAATAETLDVLDSGFTSIGKYLDDLMAGGPDVPLSLFPVYKKLLEARGVQRVAESDLFFPDLSVRAPRSDAVAPVPEAEVPRYVRGLRTKYQKGLLAYLKNAGDRAGLTAMREALAEVEATQTQPASRTFWWTAVGFIDALLDGGIVPQFNVKSLCGRIDQQIRRVGESTAKVAEKLNRDVLYYVATAQPASERLAQIKQTFELSAHLPTHTAASPSDQALERTKPLLRELSDLISAAKEAWLKFTAGNKDILKIFQDHTRRALTKAKALDFQPLVGLVDTLAHSADTLAERGDVSEAVSMEMATALLLIESAAQNFARLTPEFAHHAEVQGRRLSAVLNGQSTADIEEVPLLDEMGRKAQEKLLLTQVGTEIQTNLRHIEQVLDAYFRDHNKRSDIPGLSSYTHQIFGALSILELERAADLLNACQLIIDKFADAAYTPNAQDMEWVAEGLSSLGFYIEAVQHGRSDAFEIIAPVIKTFPGIQNRVLREAESSEAAPVEEEIALVPEAPIASVEAGIEEQKRDVQNLYEAWRASPTPETRNALRAQLTSLGQDADLIDDTQLKGRVSKTLAALDVASDPNDERVSSVLSELTAPRVAAVAPSQETSRLIEASKEVIDRELLETYLEEAQEVLERVDQNLIVIRRRPHDHEALVTIRRGFHTLKGSGRMVGLTDLGEVAWGIEQTMNRWLEEEKDASPELISMLQSAHDAFAGWVEILNREGSVAVNAEALLAQASALREDPSGPFDLSARREALVASRRAAAEEELASAHHGQRASDLTAASANEELAPSTALLDGEAGRDSNQVSLDSEPAEKQAEPTEAIEEINLSSAPIAEGRAPEADATLSATPDFIQAVDTENVSELTTTLDPVPDSAPRSAPESYATEEASSASPVDSEADASALEQAQLQSADDATPHLAQAEAATAQDEAPDSHPVAAPDNAQPDNAEIEVGGVAVSSALHRLFLDEAAQYLDILEQGLSELSDPKNLSGHEDLVRAAHTLAGISSTVGFYAPADLAHEFEQWLTDLVHHPRALAQDELSQARSALTRLRGMVASIQALDLPQPERDLSERLRQMVIDARHTREAAEADAQTAAQDGAADESIPDSNSVAAPATPPLSSAPAESTPTIAPRVVSMPEPATPIEIDSSIKDDLDEQLLPVFLEEAQELMPFIGTQLRTWRAAPSDTPAAQALNRALHTLKGSARMAGAMRLGDLTHRMETRALAVAEAEVREDSMFEELDRHFDAISDVHEALIRGDQAPAAPEVAAQAARIETIMPVALGVSRPSTVPQSGMLAEMEQAAARAVLRVRADTVDRLVNEAGEVSITRSRIEGEMQHFKQSLKELTENVIRLRGQLREIEIQAESQMQSRISAAQDTQFDPLEFDRFTRLQEVTRMMAESVNDVATVQQNMLKNLDEAEGALIAQGRLNRELQQGLMRIRMVPMSSVTERLHRIVRQTAKETGKRAALKVEGESVELDRSVLEKMTAPFEHLLRNAVAHGIETEQDREIAGKNETGAIELRARQEGNEVVLTIRDDGAGIDLERVRAKAIELGMLGAQEETTPNKLMELIFNAGFSTASEVTQIAGRGVGMDVVRNEIAGLGGRIEVTSNKGYGSTFTIYLPLTLAVTQVVMVRSGENQFAIPASMVEQVQEVKALALSDIYQKGQVDWLGNTYPLHYLPRLLGDDETMPEAKQYTSIMLLRSGTQRAAIHVDSLERNQEVVVKNIGPQLARVSGISGATVLGNGQIVLILNPVQLANREAPHVGGQAVTPAKAAEPQTAPVIMVVDDSLTVRKITGRLLSKEGYQVVTAKDGVDALQQLQEIQPAVMLVDIEMPRMDGFELTKNVRGDAQMAHIPIIMITSRTAEKHRNYARELGVNVYLGKPYQEEELLGHIATFIKEGARVTTPV